MRLIKLIFIFLLCVNSPRLVFALSPGEEIKKKQTQLDKLRDEIERYETKIKESEKKEKTTLDVLSSYDKQAVLLRKLIRKLREEEQELQKGIDETKRIIKELSGQMSFLKQNYADYVKTVYKYGRTYDLELLLSSKSFNELLIRSEYLKRFSEQRRRDLEKIDTKRFSI